jgi:hypothetical protein
MSGKGNFMPEALPPPVDDMFNRQTSRQQLVLKRIFNELKRRSTREGKALRCRGTRATFRGATAATRVKSARAERRQQQHRHHHLHQQQRMMQWGWWRRSIGSGSMRRRLWPKAEVQVAAAATHFTHKYKQNGCIINSDV